MSPRAKVVKRKKSERETSVTPRKLKRTASHEEEELPLPKCNSVSGAVLVFGEGVAGQLGLGEENTEKKRPTAVPGLTQVLDIAAGGMHTVCLTADHKLITFGCNDEGALGRDTSEEGSEFEPGQVKIPSAPETKVVQISAGDSHTAVLLDDGTVYVWGSFRDSHGPMGLLKDKKIEKLPIQIQTEVKMVRISSGTHHLVLLGQDHQLYSCGCPEQGQLGRVPERSASRNSRHGMGQLIVPSLIQFSPRVKIKFVDVWTGSFCTFAKEKTNGDIYVFGLNNYKQIGLDSLGIHFRPLLSKVFSGVRWASLSGGDHHTAALDNNGTVYTMGRKEYGRLGLGKDCEDAAKPTIVSSLAEMKCVDVTCGSFVTLAAMEDGKLYSWGMGSSQLGLGHGEDVFVPTEVKSKQLVGKKVVKVSSGGQHTVVLVTSHQVPS